MRRLVVETGGTEGDAYVAAWAYGELVGAVACTLHPERYDVLDYRTEPAPMGAPDWPDTPDVAAAHERCERTTGELWNYWNKLSDDLLDIGRWARI